MLYQVAQSRSSLHITQLAVPSRCCQQLSRPVMWRPCDASPPPVAVKGVGVLLRVVQRDLPVHRHHVLLARDAPAQAVGLQPLDAGVEARRHALKGLRWRTHQQQQLHLWAVQTRRRHITCVSAPPASSPCMAHRAAGARGGASVCCFERQTRTAACTPAAQRHLLSCGKRADPAHLHVHTPAGCCHVAAAPATQPVQRIFKQTQRCQHVVLH